MTFSDTLHGWFVSGKGVFSTTDGGLHWTSFATNRNWVGANLQFVDPMHGWAFFPFQTHPWMLRTEDGGHTWTQLNLTRSA